jgi:hypothetical protein
MHHLMKHKVTSQTKHTITLLICFILAFDGVASQEKLMFSLLQHTSVQAVWFATTQAVPGTACGAPPVM